MSDVESKRTELFPLGILCMTPGVEDCVPMLRALACLTRHARGDWGSVCQEDREMNEQALAGSGRLFSVYTINPRNPSEGSENCFWIITEADRSTTTLLLPDEY